MKMIGHWARCERWGIVWLLVRKDKRRVPEMQVDLD